MGAAATRFLEPDPTAPPIDVRVVIPARNEVDNIAACMHAARRQTTEVVVVDDGSTDGTGDAAAAAGARVLRLDAGPPAGWTGKAWACQAGGEGATTMWLAFVDADVVLHPHALATMAAATGHTSTSPTSTSPTSTTPTSTSSTSTSIVGGLECRSFWERLLLPELGLALVQEGLPPDFASGHCFLVRRDRYEAVGGHGHPDVRGSVVDDRDLARVLTGHEPRLAPRLLRARMYRNGSELRMGLLKNQAALHPRPFVHLAGLLVPIATRRPWAIMAVSAAGRVASGQNPVYGLLAPLARVALAGIYLESWWRARSGRPVDWKERPVTLGGRSGPGRPVTGPG